MAEVVFGSPKKRCAGVGICSMNPLHETQRNSAFPCHKTIAQLTVLQHETLQIRLEKDGLCDQLAGRQFPKHKFTLKQNFKLPATICAALDIQQGTVPAGVYPVEETDNSFVLALALIW